MNHQDCDQIIKSYIEWLRNGLSAECLDNICELTTPFLDSHNDHIQVYADKRNNIIILSDDGYTLADLRTSGVNPESSKRKLIIDSIINGFGVQRDGNQLMVEASYKNLGQRMHSLIQAILSINDMFVLAEPRVESFFWEDVRAFLDEKEIRYSSRVKIAGRSGFDHAIDFLIPKSKTRPERIIQAINAPNKNTIGNYLFSLNDTREARDIVAEAYAILNDRDREVGGEVIEALKAYEVKPALWSERRIFTQELID